MRLKDRLKSILCYYSLTKEDYQKIAEDMKEGSLNMINILSGFSFILMGALFFYSFFFQSWAKYRYIYICFFFAFLVVYVFSRLNKEWRIFSPNFTIYGFLIVFYSFTAIDSIMYSPNIISLEPVVILFLISAFFYFNMIETFVFISVITTVSSLISYFYSAEGIREININNFIIYGLINLVLSFLINRTYAIGFLNAYKAREAGYMDFMTGLHNRNHYKSVLPELISKVRNNIICVYVDANDLHRINNESGHEMGDKMLICIADILKELFQEEYSFRMGGDEFVAFAVDKEDEIEEKCRDFKERVRKAGYNASLGYEILYNPKEEDMNELIKAAEEKMYQDKKIFYEMNGRDRRSR